MLIPANAVLSGICHAIQFVMPLDFRTLCKPELEQRKEDFKAKTRVLKSEYGEARARACQVNRISRQEIRQQVGFRKCCHRNISTFGDEVQAGGMHAFVVPHPYKNVKNPAQAAPLRVYFSSYIIRLNNALIKKG
eukprot:scaffold46083_cov31-Tisochrysis_lutea.AAC.1